MANNDGDRPSNFISDPGLSLLDPRRSTSLLSSMEKSKFPAVSDGGIVVPGVQFEARTEANEHFLPRFCTGVGKTMTTTVDNTCNSPTGVQAESIHPGDPCGNDVNDEVESNREIVLYNPPEEEGESDDEDFSNCDDSNGDDVDLSGSLIGVKWKHWSELYDLYRRHACVTGFSVRKSTGRWRTFGGEFKLSEKYFVCSCEGKVDGEKGLRTMMETVQYPLMHFLKCQSVEFVRV